FITVIFLVPFHQSVSKAEIAPSINQSGRLAILIAAPATKEKAMHNDITAMYDVLLKRGFAPREILVIEGPLNHTLLMAILQESSKQIKQWKNGEVFLYYTGHGEFTGDSLSNVRPGVALSGEPGEASESFVGWDEIFQVLDLSPAIKLLLLADS
ncbi:MAG: hypothetical protein AB1489_39730, partial [Acidobacteriota bacterium]